ncbi:hypothetical protein RUM43_005766 [Polyplax serrata]|uniref:Uncharacterized protein n=1 Tax=Polyplax serrata TaxID=468196 RepID=A0AAN8P0G1_POLSC
MKDQMLKPQQTSHLANHAQPKRQKETLDWSKGHQRQTELRATFQTPNIKAIPSAQIQIQVFEKDEQNGSVQKGHTKDTQQRHAETCREADELVGYQKTHKSGTTKRSFGQVSDQAH